MNGQQAFFEALLDPGQPPPSGLTAWNGSDPAARFAVYRNNVMASLVDALANTYPVTHELVGETFFRAMAQLFVHAEPPRSRVLAFYGEAFPDFVERFPPAASVPYLADVARLERLRVHAYHAADGATLSTETIAEALTNNAGGLPDLRVAFHPSTGLLRSPYAVVSLWAAHQGITDIASVDPLVPENALIVRPELDVEVLGLDAGASDFVARLLQGESLGGAAEQVGHTYPDFDLARLLGLLIQKQAITSMKASSRRQP
jgi:hypothetical protein